MMDMKTADILSRIDENKHYNKDDAHTGPDPKNATSSVHIP